MDSCIYPKKIDTIDQLKSGYRKFLFLLRDLIFQKMHLNTFMTFMSYKLPIQQHAQLKKLMTKTL